ncbi:DNA repair protein RecO [Collinsella sp. AGMB00827]|uniref:DNA repair protein RecO n=1 Tax=Collinsella ureilytica TaxID=2869515 RepID=A0ABS7MLP2_9ACTN|nr:DNA repair protein RecO [Collinsella urealyticum]
MSRSRTYRIAALVLAKVKLKETDLILTLLAQDGRRIQAVAKGARKPGSRLAARSELCTTIDVLLARGRSLDIVSQAELIAAPLGSAPDLEALSAALAIADLARHACFEDTEDPFVFSITQSAFDWCSKVSGAKLDLLVGAYTFKLLAHIGYRPEWETCVSCNDEDVSRFSAEAGGLICASCAKTLPAAIPVSQAVQSWLKVLLPLRFDDLLAEDIDTSVAFDLAELALRWAATHLEVRLKSMEFMLGR